MTLYRMFDASSPPAAPPHGFHAVAGYIGGRTPHVWSVGEWNAASNGGQLRMLPIWVSTGLATGPMTQAKLAAQAAIGLGWKAYHPERRAIVLDEETETRPDFVKAFADELHRLGFSCWPYGSKSSIFGDPSEDGIWLALYDDVAGLEHFPHVVAHQYAADVPVPGEPGKRIDLSVISAAALGHLGHGPRRLVTS